jgi:hypothetical protein
MSDAKTVGNIAQIFLQVKIMLEIYHWNTYSYSRHKASNKLLHNLSKKMDLFVESIQGSRGVRLELERNSTINLEKLTDDRIVIILKQFREWLTKSLSNVILPRETDLLNIRDEIISQLDLGLYLFTLK